MKKPGVVNQTYWTDALNEMGIVAICQMLHTATHQGEFDYRQKQVKELERATAVAHLRAKIEGWRHGHPSSVAFDNAVHALIVATLNEQEELHPTGTGMLESKP